MDRRETRGNSLGRAPVGRSDTGVTTGWTEGRSDDRVDGRETVGNSWTERKELRWEGAMRE